MADKVPLKLVDNGSGIGSLVEFAVGDTVPAANLTKAIAVALTGLVAGTNTAIVVTDTILSALQNLQAQTTAAIAYRTGSGYIDGLVPVWNSASSISVTSGSAYIPGLGANLAVPAMLTLSGLTLTANTFYHLYLYSNAGVAAIELVTTVPSAPYSGSAITKTGDTSRRYIGSVLTLAANTLAKFTQDGTRVSYLEFVAATPFAVVGGTATVATNVSCAACVPVTSRYAGAVVTNNSTTAYVRISQPEQSVAVSSSAHQVSITAGGLIAIDLPLDSLQRFSYIMDVATTGAVTVRVYGYIYQR